MTGLILFGSFAILLILGVPIAMSLGAAGMVTILFSPNVHLSINVIAQRIFGGLDSTSIMAIAFFVLAGNIMTKGGISRRLVEFANSIVGGFRGGLGLALVLACAFFAALSGSAPATVVAIGVMLYPDMVKLGYPKERTAGLLVVSGGLGPIIPPSIIMVVYATITGASVGDMFKSGMAIGIFIMLVLMSVVIFYANKEKWPQTRVKMSLNEFFISFFKAIPALLLPIIILGGIYSGMLTPTESSAIAVVWSLITGMFIYREVSNFFGLGKGFSNDFIYYCYFNIFCLVICFWRNISTTCKFCCRIEIISNNVLFRGSNHSSHIWGIFRRNSNLCINGSSIMAYC